jgi:hypothetical protein
MPRDIQTNTCDKSTTIQEHHLMSGCYSDIEMKKRGERNKQQCKNTIVGNDVSQCLSDYTHKRLCWAARRGIAEIMKEVKRWSVK